MIAPPSSLRVEDIVSEAEHGFVLVDGLFDLSEGEVTGVEPLHLDGLAEFLHARFVGADGASRGARVVATLDDEDGGADLLDIGDGRGAAVEIGLLLRRADEESELVAAQGVRRVLVGHGPVGDSDASHAASPEVGTPAEAEQGEIAAIGPASEEDLIGSGDALLHEPVAGGCHVFDLPVAEVAPDLLLKLAAKGGRAAIVNGQEGEAVIDPELIGRRENFGHDGGWPTMRMQDGWERPLAFWQAQPALNGLPIRRGDGYRLPGMAGRYLARRQHGTPLLARFGIERDQLRGVRGVLPGSEDFALRPEKGATEVGESAVGMFQRDQLLLLKVVEVETLHRLVELHEQDAPAIGRPVERLDLALQCVERQSAALTRERVPEQGALDAAAIRCCQQARITGERREHGRVYAAFRAIPQFGNMLPARGIERQQAHIQAAGTLTAANYHNFAIIRKRQPAHNAFAMEKLARRAGLALLINSQHVEMKAFRVRHNHSDCVAGAAEGEAGGGVRRQIGRDIFRRSTF